MFDSIPFEIQMEIMKRLPLKSVIQFRSVSKTWKTLISNSSFIANYLSQQQHLFVIFKHHEDQYVSFVDDNTFPQQKVIQTVPVMVKMLKSPTIIGSSHGLVCFYCELTLKAVLWNISIRKAIVIIPPTSTRYRPTLGFGVCRETNDPKIVKIKCVFQLKAGGMKESDFSNIPSQVEVFTLSTGAWRSSYGNLPRKSTHFYRGNEVIVSGVFYWFATDLLASDWNTLFVVSFDMTREEFREITLPDGPKLDIYNYSMSYLGNSLIVCRYDERVINTDICVWMLEGGVSNSFTKLYTIAPNGDAILRGFRKSGEPIIGIRVGGSREQLAVYEPHSKRIDFLRIFGLKSFFEVYFYMETLFLLDQPDDMVYNGV